MGTRVAGIARPFAMNFFNKSSAAQDVLACGQLGDVIDDKQPLKAPVAPESPLLDDQDVPTTSTNANPWENKVRRATQRL